MFMVDTTANVYGGKRVILPGAITYGMVTFMIRNG